MSIVLQGSTSGSITLQEPAVAGSTVLSLPATTGTVLTSASPSSDLPSSINGPTFRATASTTTTLSANTWTKVNYATETWDTNNNFASNRFTPTVAGYYQINATFGEGLSASGMNFYIAIYKNGSEFTKMQYVASSAWYTNIPISCLVYCNGSTDYVEIYAFTSSAYTNTASGATNWFDGCLVRGA